MRLDTRRWMNLSNSDKVQNHGYLLFDMEVSYKVHHTQQGTFPRVHIASHNHGYKMNTERMEVSQHYNHEMFQLNQRLILTLLLHFFSHLEWTHTFPQRFSQGGQGELPWHKLSHMCPQSNILWHFTLQEWRPSQSLQLHDCVDNLNIVTMSTRKEWMWQTLAG